MRLIMNLLIGLMVIGGIGVALYLVVLIADAFLELIDLIELINEFSREKTEEDSGP